MKKISVLALAISLVSGSQAFAAAKGFFMGGGFGLNNMRGQHTYKNGDNGATGVRKYNKTSSAMSLNIGYMTAIGEGHNLIGGELYGLTFGSRASKPLQFQGGYVEGSVLVKHKNSGGLAVIFGSLLNPKMFIYAKCGYEFQSYDFQFRDVTYMTNPNFKSSKSTSAIVPSLGLMVRTSKNFAIGGELSMPVVTSMEVKDPTVRVDGFRTGFTHAPAGYRLLFKLAYTFGGGK